MSVYYKKSRLILSKVKKPYFQKLALSLCSIFFLLSIEANAIQNPTLPSIELLTNPPKNDQSDISLELIADFSPNLIKKGETTTLTILGRVGKRYHIYSVFPQGEFAPKPTEVFLENQWLSKINSTTESETTNIHDQAFDLSLKIHQNDFWISNEYVLSNVTHPGKNVIDGYLTYQICDNRICSLPTKRYFKATIEIQ